MICGLLLGAISVDAQDMAIAPQFEDARPFHAGVGRVKLNGVWGLVDRAGRMVVLPQYEQIRPGSEGIFAVNRGEPSLWSYIDATGKPLHDSSMKEARPFFKGWAAVVPYGTEWSLIKPSGARVAREGWTEIAGWDPPFAIVKSDGTWRVIHIGDFGFVNEVVNLSQEAAFVSEQEITSASAPLNRKFVLTSPAGQTIGQLYSPGHEPGLYLTFAMPTPHEGGVGFYPKVGAVGDGLVPVQFDDGTWAYFHLDRQQFVWERGYEGARAFHEGLAAFQQNGLWGYINRGGEVVVTPKYTRAYDFYAGYATMRQGDERGFLQVDAGGKISEYLAPQFEDVFRFQEGLAPVKIDGKWGYIGDGKTPDVDLRQSPIETLIPADP
ncbi:MAG: WG repeat-containing protein [Aliishimia sp.]